MNIMFVANNAYINQLLVTLNSIFVNQTGEINIYLISDGLSKENYQIVEQFIHKRHGKLIYKCYEAVCIDTDKIINNRWNPIVFYKLYGIFDINNIRKILYLDLDIIVNADLSELYETELEGYYAAVVQDSGLKQVELNYGEHLWQLMVELDEYFNAGVMLLNLEKIQREMNLEYLILQYNKYANLFIYNEQDLLNMVWHSRLKYMNYKYNRLATDFMYRKYIEKDPDVVIYHYTIDKPWGQENSKKITAYQWCVKKYLQYAKAQETYSFYRKVKKANDNICDKIVSKIKSTVKYNPFIFTDGRCGWRHFLKELFFIMDGDKE